MYSDPFSIKQRDFILNSTAKYNIAHGSVRSGKTVGVFFRFLQAVHQSEGDQIWMLGHTHETIYHNCVRLIFESPQFAIFKPFANWFGKGVLKLFNKSIYCLGARDERAIGPIQGKTFDLCYCNEMTLYPENVIQMISTRLSMPHSKLFADMNPVQPSHICKKWVDLAEQGDKDYFAMHFTIDDNPYLTEEYKKIQRQTLTGLFYRRNYLGEWCLAEGAIFDFFDKNIHVEKYPRRSQEFWILGIDYGASNAFAAVLIGVNTGRYTQEGGFFWVEKEYYWDPKKQGKQKTNAEFARDLVKFIEAYDVRTVYIDPSAASMKVELKRNEIHTVDADNDVYDGILVMTNLMKEGTLTISPNCPNLIREIEGYVWDPKASEKGIDAPLKQNDHSVDALRYAIKSYMRGRATLTNPVNSSSPDFGRNLGRQFQDGPSYGWQSFR